MAAQSVAINVTGTGALFPGVCTLRGFWITATGANASVTIYDNASAASGTVLASFTLASIGQYAWLDLSDGLRCTQGIYVSASGGAIVGNVRIG
jgi:hypothetical protein